MAQNKFPQFKNYGEYEEWIKNNVTLVVKDPPKGGTVDLGFVEQLILEENDGD